jgi:hypothetical protein
MAQFIKLTGVWAPYDPTPLGPVYANVNHIAGFTRPDFDPVLSPEGGEQVTLLMLSGGEGGAESKGTDVFVAEAPEQILALINAAQSKDAAQ